MAALTSFCSKYSHPFCRVLVAAVLQEPGEGVVGWWEVWLLLGAGEGPQLQSAVSWEAFEVLGTLEEWGSFFLGR